MIDPGQAPELYVDSRGIIEVKGKGKVPLVISHFVCYFRHGTLSRARATCRGPASSQSDRSAKCPAVWKARARLLLLTVPAQMLLRCWVPTLPLP